MDIDAIVAIEAKAIPYPAYMASKNPCQFLHPFTLLIRNSPCA